MEDIIARVENLVQPVLDSEGLELVEVQYRREKPGWVLRLFIDRKPLREESGEIPGARVTLDDCVAVSREVGRLLDVEEALANSYTLEVSSPGLDRLLTKPSDFSRFTGRKIVVKAVGPEGRRKVKGRLLGLADGKISLEVDRDVVLIPFEQAEKVRLEPEVNWPKGPQ
ncbi:MAG: ribosome maturation factor RimP [Pseudomonadota bacterium]